MYHHPHYPHSCLSLTGGQAERKKWGGSECKRETEREIGREGRKRRRESTGRQVGKAWTRQVRHRWKFVLHKANDRSSQSGPRNSRVMVFTQLPRSKMSHLIKVVFCLSFKVRYYAKLSILTITCRYFDFYFYFFLTYTHLHMHVLFKVNSFSSLFIILD